MGRRVIVATYKGESNTGVEILIEAFKNIMKAAGNSLLVSQSLQLPDFSALLSDLTKDGTKVDPLALIKARKSVKEKIGNNCRIK